MTQNKYRRITSTHLFYLLLAAALTLALTSGTALAHVWTTGLLNPVKIIFTPGGNLLVAEGGRGPNTGRISLVDRQGYAHTVLDGLPSGPSLANNTPVGPTGLLLQGNTLFITCGSGNTVIPGPRPATESPNPNGPASPLLSSLLVVRFSKDPDALASGFTLAPAQHFRLADGFEVALENSAGEQAVIEVVADFRDYLADPVLIVRNSNPFGVAQIGGRLYLPDASQNTIIAVNSRTGRAQTLVRFAQLTNPTPVGPPRIDTVPNSIRRFGEQLLVTFLTGFPFPPATAEVRTVNPRTGASEVLIAGLRSAIDVIPAAGTRFFVLEYSANQLMGAPGRLLRFDGPRATPVVLTDSLVTPTSMAYDPVAEEIFVTEISTGRIIKVRVG